MFAKREIAWTAEGLSKPSITMRHDLSLTSREVELAVALKDVLFKEHKLSQDVFIGLKRKSGI